MDVRILASLLILLFISLFVIIPTYASKDKQKEIQNWVGMGFSGLLLLIVTFQTRDPTLCVPIMFYLFVLGVILSGIYWWIPKYIPKDNQNSAINNMFLASTLAIILVNSSSPSMAATLPPAATNALMNIVRGGKKRG